MAKYVRVFFCYVLLHIFCVRFVAYIANTNVCNFNIETQK